MASAVTMKVDGLSDLGRRMLTLKADVALKMGPRATGKAASIVKKAAKAKLKSASTDTGLLGKNVIAKKMGKNRTRLTAEHIVTVKKAVYPKNSEGGERTTRRVGVFKEFDTKFVKAEPFLAPALSENTSRAIDAMTNSLLADLAKYGK